ncbi:POZ domain-containing protein [Neoconidiobolus thromboides FSU 785]|nr:POZ domain-containing protein [Neoconidiobolus thromboides FSU 785]
MEGDKNQYVKLVSSEGFEFILNKQVAMGSKTIQNMLNGPASFLEASTNRIEFRDISGIILEKVVDYLHYKARYQSSPGYDVPSIKIEPELAIELLMASDFLDV